MLQAVAINHQGLERQQSKRSLIATHDVLQLFHSYVLKNMIQNIWAKLAGEIQTVGGHQGLRTVSTKPSIRTCLDPTLFGPTTGHGSFLLAPIAESPPPAMMFSANKTQLRHGFPKHDRIQIADGILVAAVSIVNSNRRCMKD